MTHLCQLSLLVALCLSGQACQIYRHDTNSEPAQRDGQPSSSGPNADQGATCQPMKATVITGPVILFHQWGARLSVQMKSMRTFLEEDDISEKNIFEPSYSYLASFETISSDLKKDLVEFMGKYPPDTKFTVITHSFGQIVALYTILTNGMESRIKRMIHFGGFANGQDKDKPFCFIGICGDALSKMVPSNNAFLKGFLSTNAAKMQSIEQCSISSSNDEKVVTPPRAGDLPTATNVLLKGFKHDELVENRDAYRQMKAQCLLKAEQCHSAPALSSY